MKENAQNNENFYNLHFYYKNKYTDLKQIREAVKKTLGINNDHVYRARLSALANPRKYGGRFVAIREFMKNQKHCAEIIVNPVIIQSENNTYEEVGQIQKT